MRSLSAPVEFIRRLPFGPTVALYPFSLAAKFLVALLGERASALRVGRSGIRYCLDLREDVQWRVFFGLYDPFEISWLSRFCRPGDVAMDVGAHVGFYTLHLARCVGSSGSVIAFEPDPRNLARLRTNLELNPFARNVTVVPAAVSNCRGTAHLFREVVQHTGRNTLHASVIDSQDSICVQCETLDEYCRDHNLEHIRFVKVDVEGHEPLVLEGARRLLEEHRIDALLVEYQTSRGQLIGLGSDWPQTLLERNGYVRLFPTSMPATNNVVNLLYTLPDRP